MPTIFFLGATGYIGGTVLFGLQKAFPSYTFKALVRSVSPIEEYNKNLSDGLPRVEPIQGTFEDADLVSQHTSAADLVINAADSDNTVLRDAILSGLRKKFAEGKGVGSLIHTSGTTIFWDGIMEGRFDPKAKVWTDDEADVRALKETQIHGPADLAILRAQEEGYLNAFIIVPSCVHGQGKGPVKRPSLFLVHYVKAVINRKAVYIGEGSNITGFVNVNDLPQLYAITSKHLIDAGGKKLPATPYERYVVASLPRQVTYKTMATLLAKALYKLGEVDSPEPISISASEAGPILLYTTSQSMLFRPGRAFSLGWTPNSPALEETFEDDVKTTLESVSTH